MKQKLSWHFWAVLLIVLNIAVTLSAGFAKNEEYAYEMADLHIMRGAAVAAQLKWKDKYPEEPVEYWYDATDLLLVPISEPKPTACGVGSPRFGGAESYFRKETGIKFANYSETESYKGKLPHVVVFKEDGGLKIIVDWVTTD